MTDKSKTLATAASLKKQLSISSNTGNCSLYRTSKIIISTKTEENLCVFCHEICKKGQPEVKATVQDSSDKCGCDHEENSDFFYNNILDYFQYMNEKDTTLRKMIAYNLLLSHKKGGKSALEMAFPEQVPLFSKDYRLCQSGSFKWDDIEIKSIENRATFVKEFNTVIAQPKIKLIFVNTLPFEEVFPLKFIDMITDCPDYTFGQPIYNQSLNFYSYLLDFFCKFYLEKDLQPMDKIDAEDIETYSPLSRLRVREKNQENQYIKDKYFNKDFNLHRFAVKLVEKFVPGATWRWIGGNHKAHIYCVKICKYLMEYGLVDDYQCEEIKNALYLKIQVYKSLEKTIDKDALKGGIGDNWIKIWTDGMKNIREYYIEILIHYLYFKQDNELKIKMKKVYQECGEDPQNLSKSKLDKLITFQKTILFEPEFSRKLMDFLLGYVLSQNTIKHEVLTTRKIQAIADNFLHIFSNIDDPYLHSLKMMREEDYLLYMKDCDENRKENEEIQKDVNLYTINIRKIISAFVRGKYFHNELAVIKELTVALDKLNERIQFIDKTEKDHAIQNVLFKSNLPFLLLNFVGNFINYHDQIIKENESDFLTKFSSFLHFYLLDNTEHHSILFMECNLYIFEDIFYLFPVEISKFLFEVYNKNSLGIIVKEYALDNYLAMFLKFYEITKANPTVDNFTALSKIIDIISLFISNKLSKISEWIPEYDLRISLEFLSVERYKEMLDYQEYEKLLAEFKADKTQLNDVKLMCYMNFLSLISISTAFRYTDSGYTLMDKQFSVDILANLIAKCGQNLSFRTIFMELYSNFHVDFKNHLVNNRSNYYFTKPADMQYEEDPFYDKEYTKTIDLLIREINFAIEYHSKEKDNDFHEETFINYLNSTLFGTLIKLMNYFLVIKEGDLRKLAKYIPKLEELKEFLASQNSHILNLYGINIEELSSPDKRQFEMAMSLIDPEMKIKMEKQQILGNCKIILETCSQIVKHRTLISNKKKLLHAKSSVIRTQKTQIKVQNFSNKLTKRRENLDLPFLKAEKTIQKTGGKNEVTLFLVAHYEHNKMVKTSVELDKNVYLFLLKDEKNSEMMAYGYNLCAFIHNSLKTEWLIDKKNPKYTMIESLIHTLFISTKSIQTNLFRIILESGDEMLNKIWVEMRTTMSFVKFKTNIDRYWKEAFRKCMILIKFHQYLCEDNSIDFKEYMRVKNLPNDTIDRVQRWTTIFQRMSDNCQWHYNYVKDEINDFDRSHRPYLLPLATGCFDNLAELCTGPCVENQKKIFTYIYDRYNGFLRRYWRDPDTEFYKAKLSLIEFIICMAEGNDPEVLNYQMTNLELNNLFSIIVNSLRQLFYCVERNDPFTSKKMSDYPLYMRDYDEIEAAFQRNLRFSKHTLLEICLRLFAYIKTFSELISKYEIFCNERDDMLVYYEKNKSINNPSIKEDDLVTYKFISRILKKIEIVRTEDEKLIPFYFPISSKCFYLSDNSKNKFLHDVDRSSVDSKLSGLYSEKNFFHKEMLFNQERYNNRVRAYKWFGSGNLVFLEIFTLILTYIINVCLAVGDESFIPLIGYLEIVGSALAILIFLYFSYPLVRELTIIRYEETTVTTEEDIWFYQRLRLSILDSFFLQKNVMVFLYHIVCISLGLYYSQVFLTFDLLSTINLFDTMQFILRSVTEHIGQLFSTLILSALLMFCFAMIVDLYFLENLDTSCTSFVNCYFYIMQDAFTNGQGLAGITEDSSTTSQTNMYELFILNIMFFIIINTVLLNIVLAILVDTFSGLRQKADFFEKDSKTICFVCGIEKFVFEKSGIDFEAHLEKEHNLWDYVNFLIFMNEKSEKDCNGVESEIFEKIKKGSLDWFPKKRSIMLEKVQDFQREEVSLDLVLNIIKKMDSKIESKLEALLKGNSRKQSLLQEKMGSGEN